MYLYKRGDLQEQYFSWCMETMKRRGPDSRKIWHNGENYISAFTRLAIRDLTKLGDQPMLSDCENYCISFNGEIYNTTDLKERLVPFRREFRSTCDTEVLLYALIFLGIDETLAITDGMFAFAFFNRLQNKLILARDRVGIKPLYVGADSNGVVYSSQYDHIVNHSFFRNEPLNTGALGSYLSLGYMAEGSGIISKTYLLPHGHYLEVSEGVMKTVNYYSYPIRSERTIGNFDETLQSSVESQLVSDVALGTFMSGGVDSNLVTYFANHHSNCQAFTIGVSGHHMDEATEASRFAEIFQARQYCKYIREDDLLELIKENSNAFTEPFADYSSLPTLLLARFAKERVTVALSGDGGDELFWGYRRNITALRSMRLYRQKGLKRKLALLSNKIRHSGSVNLSRHWEFEDFVEYYHSTFNITGALQWVPEICSRDVEHSLFYCISKRLYHEDCSDTDLMNILRKMEVDIHLQRILLKVDRASMHYSLETRVPFLSNKMLDFSAQYSHQDCIKGDHGKMPLKNSLAEKTEPGLVFREKKGFSIPLDNWIRKEIRKDVTEKILDMPPALAIHFRKGKLELLLKQHMERQHNFGWIIWAIYSLVNWEATQLNKYRQCA